VVAVVEVVQLDGSATLAGSLSTRTLEWRNLVDGMACRQDGATNTIVSMVAFQNTSVPRVARLAGRTSPRVMMDIAKASFSMVARPSGSTSRMRFLADSNAFRMILVSLEPDANVTSSTVERRNAYTPMLVTDAGTWMDLSTVHWPLV